MDTNFNSIKDEILRRAKEAHACTAQYGRAYKAESLQELCEVIKDNFDWAYHNRVIDAALLMQYLNWVWQGGYLEELKRSKMALFRLDAKEIINRELNLTL